MLALFYKHLFFLFENALSFSVQNSTYYLEALTENESFFYLFSTTIPYFCIFTFRIIQEFLHLCTYVDDMVVISSLGENYQLETANSFIFNFPLRLIWKWKKWFSTWKKIWCCIYMSLVSPLSDFFLHLLHLLLKYQNANALTFITSAEVRAFE